MKTRNARLEQIINYLKKDVDIFSDASLSERVKHDRRIARTLRNMNCAMVQVCLRNNRTVIQLIIHGENHREVKEYLHNAYKNQIQKSIGETLDWRLHDNFDTSRIEYKIGAGIDNFDNRWTDNHEMAREIAEKTERFVNIFENYAGKIPQHLL